MIYPVGSYYVTESAELNTEAKMNSYFGGEWTQITDKFLYASNSAGTEGGEKNHTLTIAEMPSHAHAMGKHVRVQLGNDNGTAYAYETSNTSYGKLYPNTENTGGSKPHNNMPPYRTVYMYRRKSLDKV